MKKISQFKSRKEWENCLWAKFLENTKKLKSEKKLNVFLDNLFTASEKKLIVKRLAALALVKAGKSYKEIEQILWISPSPISALKKCVYQNDGYFSNRYYAAKSSSEKRKKIKGLPPRTIFDYWLNMPMPTKTGRGRWKFLYYQG